MAENQHLFWTPKGTQTAVKDQDFLDAYSMYDFFNAANATRVHQRRLGMRARSAAPKIGTRNSIETSNERNSLKMHSYLRNPSPTPATSPPLSARSRQSVLNSATPSKHTVNVKHSSPTTLYLGFHKTRSKSAPPRPTRYYLPKSPKTAKSQPRLSVSSFGNGPKQAWQNRTSSANGCHSLLSPKEVDQRHKDRCKSAPLLNDLSCIEHVTSVRGHGSDIQKLKALTSPLTCMPEVVQSVLSSNNLRHCCSAYHPRPKTSPNMRKQFWPVTRPAVFQRGNVPKYLHFVKPAGLWVHGADIHHTSGSDDNVSGTDEPNAYDMSTGTNLSRHGSDEMDVTFLHEEQFLVSASPSVESLSDQENWPELEVNLDAQAPEDLEAIPSGDLDNEILSVGEDAEKPSDKTETQTLPVEERVWDVKISQPQEQCFKMTVTEVESLLVMQEPNKEHQEQRRPEDEEPTVQDVGLEIVVSQIPLEEKGTEAGSETGRNFITATPLKQEPSSIPVLEQPSEHASDPAEGHAEERSVETPDQANVVSKTPQVKFSEVLILTSFKAPGVKEETRVLPMKPILNPAPAKKQAALPPVLEKPKLPQVELQKKTVTTSLPRKAQLMTTAEEPVASKEEEHQQEQAEKEAEAKKDEPLKLEAAVLPQPEYIHAPGAYRMYEPKDLLQYQIEQHCKESTSKKKSLTASTLHFVPSPETTAVMTSILDDQKRLKEGMKPWLQGRLALSRQTSRFELPMDVRLLEDMTPMEYLTKYCIISPRRKALYKHIFQKVDRDRDNFITFKEMDKGLKDVHVDYIDTEQVKKLVQMVESTEKSVFNLQQFSAIAAFSERLLLSESQANEKDHVYSSKEIIEEADFCGLKAKLSGFAVNPTVKKILEVL